MTVALTTADSWALAILALFLVGLVLWDLTLMHRKNKHAGDDLSKPYNQEDE